MSAMPALRAGLPGRLSEDGYSLPPDLTFDEWCGVLAMAEFIERASPWWVCDALAYGQARFGQDHTQAFPDPIEDPAGVRTAKLKQAAWMADRWPPGTRVPGQSYTAHRVVARLQREDAVALLEERDADGRRLSTRELARRADEIEQAITAPSTPVETGCAVDTCEGLTVQDLTADARAALHRIAHDQRVLPEVAGRVFVAALIWAGALDAFTREPGT